MKKCGSVPSTQHRLTRRFRRAHEGARRVAQHSTPLRIITSRLICKAVSFFYPQFSLHPQPHTNLTTTATTSREKNPQEKMPNPLPPTLTSRNALLHDVPSLASLLVSSPDDGTLYQFPNVLDYPEEMHKLHMSWLRPEIRSPTTLIRVAVLPQDGGEDVVVGFSSWMKREMDPEAEGSTRVVEIGRVNWADSDGMYSDTNFVTFCLNCADKDMLETRESNDGNIADDSQPDLVPGSGPSKALEPNPIHSKAIRRVRKRAPPSPAESTPGYELNGLAIRAEYQGYGIGSLLVRWGLDRASEEGLPVFATGEAQGVNFYEKAMRFQKLLGSEYWLDKDGRDISASDVQGGNDGWTKANGGLSGAEMIWCPKGYKLNIRGVEYEA